MLSRNVRCKPSWLLFGLLVTLTWTMPSAVCQQESQRGKPLTVQERRRIAEQLVELWLKAQEKQQLEGITDKERAVAARELTNCFELVSIKDAGLAVAADKLAVCEERVKLKTDEAETYKRLYDTVRKKPFCWKRVFTLGIGKCK